jgi:hypothetical protein
MNTAHKIAIYNTTLIWVANKVRSSAATHQLWRIRGFQSCDFEVFYLLGYNSLLPTCSHAGFLFGLFFDHEDGGDMFL